MAITDLMINEQIRDKEIRGREIGHSKAGMLILENFAKETAEFGVIDKEPKMEGKSLVMFLAPKG